MVAVARGLMAKPRLLLLDEPSLGLAPLIVQQVFRIVADIRAPRHHRPAGRAERPHGPLGGGPRLRAGDRPAAGAGKPDELWSNPQVRAAYLGGIAAAS